MQKLSRAQKGILISLAGSFVNLVLASVKISIGLIAGSISVLLDGFNNFTDIFTSGATAFGFGISDIERNDKYPHGYGRIEYIISLLVSIVVIIVGVGFLFSAIERILIPQPIGFSWIYFYIIAFTVLIKVFMGIFYNKSNKSLHSMPLKALSLDSFQDAAITSFVLLTFGLSRVTGLPIDALCAILMSVTIFINSGKLTSKALKALLGRADETLRNKINECLSKDFKAKDLIIYDCGYNKLYGYVTVIMEEERCLKEALLKISEKEKSIFNDFNVNLKISIDIK